MVGGNRPLVAKTLFAMAISILLVTVVALIFVTR
jgi:hypothetical protein